jgi:LacI family transcriptional regulator
MMKKRYPVTLQDIADHLHVSKVTVSKALRDHPDISLNTKQLVLEEVNRLGYVPNFIARNLSAKKSNTIGLVVPRVAHYFFASIIESIYNKAYQNNYEIIMAISQEDPEKEKQHIQTLLSMRVDGLLISLSEKTADHTIFTMLKDRGVPLVFFDRVIEDLGLSTVTSDDRGGARDLTRYMIKAGYTKIGHFSGYSYTNIGRERKAGFLEAMGEAHLEMRSEWLLEGGFSVKDGYSHFCQLIKNGNLPEIIFAVSYPSALGIYAAAQENKLAIPDDIDVVCFGGSDYNRFVSPALTYVDQPTDELGCRALEILFKEIQNPDYIQEQHIVLPTKIVQGKTCLFKN